MASIQKELASGIIYTAISKYSGIIISLAVAGVLARLIDPEEFGVVAIATVIISFFSIFSQLHHIYTGDNYALCTRQVLLSLDQPE